MTASKPLLWMTTEDPYAVYGPGDKVRGTANVEASSPVLTKYVVVSLLAGSRVSPASTVKPCKQSFFHKQFKMLFHNRREDPTRQLEVGSHKWEFEFTFPSANELPPSFIYKDPNGTAEILYCLVMCIYQSATSGPNKENMSTLSLKYSPQKSSSVAVDGLPHLNLYLCQPLIVKVRRPSVEGPLRKKTLLSLLTHFARQRKVERGFHVTLWLPKRATFTDHLDISLKIEPFPDFSPMHSENLRLVRVEYRLWGLTRITHGQSTRTSRHQVQSNICYCSTLFESNTHWTSLRHHAPFKVLQRIHGVPLDKVTFSSLPPSFAWHSISREYSLDIDVFIKIHGRLHRIRFEDNDLIILPQGLRLENE